MAWFQTYALAVVCFLIDVSVLLVSGQDSDVSTHATPDLLCPSDSLVNCYDCRTTSGSRDPYCGDPFNSSHPEVKVIACEDFCTKWVVQLANGEIQTTRTCSNKLDLNLRIYTVCMRESASDTGLLCFCDGERCNAAIALTSHRWTYVICTLFACLLKFSNTGFLSV